jgi:hypothetical protein
MAEMICKEYLEWMNLKIKRDGNRKVLLLMDNFSSHELAVNLVGGITSLSNIQIKWISPNTTSHWQPLDQGIIASFKLHYCRMWVAYIIQQFDVDKDPLKTVTLLNAIEWTVEA